MPGAGRRPGRPGGDIVPAWAGTPRRPRRPAARWRWPGRSATRPGRREPWGLGYAAFYAGDHDSAVRLARQAAQITAGVPGSVARWCSSACRALIEAGDLAAAEPVCAAALARSRDAGDLWNQACLLAQMATLDLQAGRIQDAAAHLRESLQLATRTGTWFCARRDLDCCGLLCAATGRHAEAVTVWAALAALLRHEESRTAR